MKHKNTKKQNSRLLLVQCLYAFYINDQEKNLRYYSSNILDHFLNKEIVDDFEENYNLDFIKIDKNFFSLIIEEFFMKNLSQNAIISKYLKKNWTIEKLDICLKSILTISTFELQFFGDIPYKVIIDDYVTITGLFYQKNEMGFVNGILQNIAQELRTNEFSISSNNL